MARHSKHERERRAAETERVKQIEAAWLGSLPAAAAKAFAESVAAARARGPQEKRPDMAPGHAAASTAPGSRAQAAQGRATAPVARTATDVSSGGPHVAANDYHFVTTWRIAATPDEIAEVLGDAVALGRWWPSVYLRVRVLDDGDARGVGRVVDLWTKGFLPYTLRWRFTVTESDPAARLPPRSVGGLRRPWHLDPPARSRRRCSRSARSTLVTYDWLVLAEKGVLKTLSPIMKPVFGANHRWAMAKGEQSLRLELARRHAAGDPTVLAAIPPAPGPTFPHNIRRAWGPAGRRNRLHRFRSADPAREGVRLGRAVGPWRPAPGRSRGVRRQAVPIAAWWREDVDDRRPVRTRRHLMGHVRRDPPGAAGSELATLVADREHDAALDDHAQLLGVVLVTRHDGVGGELDHRQRDPIALDAARADGLAPDVDDRRGFDVDEIAHVGLLGS